MTQHKAIPLDQRHAPYSFEYADAAARLGAVGLIAADVGKLARQLDDNSLWMLTNHVGPTWVQQGFGSADMIRADGTVAFTGDQSMGGFALTDLDDAVDPQDALTLAQHDAFANAHVTSGFPNLLTDSTVTWTEGTREIAIAPTGATFEVWSDGVQHLKGASAINISDVTGWHFVYFDAAGTLVESVNPSAATIATIIKTLGLVAIVDWDGVNHRRIWRGDERHGTVMDGADHYHWHTSVGTTYQSGCTPETFAADQSGALAAHAQFGMSVGAISDEDIEFTSGAHGSTANWHVLYKTGATGAWQTVHPKAAFPVATTGTGRLAWNEFTGGAWQLTEIVNGRFVLCHVFATTDPDDPYMAVVGQAEYANLNAARAAAPEELLTINTAGLPAQELLWVATVIYQTDNTYTNAVKGRVRTLDGVDTFIDWRQAKMSGASTSTLDHGSMGGLTDPDHALTATYLDTGNTVATVTDLKQALLRAWGAGSLTGFALTEVGDGTVNIAAGEAMLRATDADDGVLQVWTVPAASALVPTNNDLSYVVAEYNAGVPRTVIATTMPNGWSRVLLYILTRVGTAVQVVDMRKLPVNYGHKTNARELAVNNISHGRTGTVVTHTGTRNVAATAGTFYYGPISVAHPSYDTSAADRMTFMYSDGGAGWTRVATQAQIPNTTYDNGSGALATLTDAYYGTYWLFCCLDTTPYLIMLYGQTQYATLAAAQAAPIPDTLPPEVRPLSTSALIAKIIVLKGAASFTEVQQPFAPFLGSTRAADHGQFEGLGDDDHPHYRTRIATVTNVAATPRAVATTDSDDILEWTGAGAGTFTLPTAVSVGSGFRLRIRNAGSAGPSVVITRAAADTFHLGASLVGTSLTTTDYGASIELVSNGVAAWRAISGDGTWTDGTITRHFDAHVPGGTTGNLVSIDANDDLQDSTVGAATVVIGPASATDHALARYHNTTGKIIQDSLVTSDDAGSVNIPTGQKYKINNVALTAADVGAAPTIHNLVDLTNHPVTGLTPGHFLKASGAAAYGFAAHGLVAADVGAEVPLTFSDSLNRAVNTVALDNDSASPGNLYYYGTNAAGTKGWHILPAIGDLGGSDMAVYSNIAGDFSVAFKDADELEVFGLPFNLTAVQIKRIIRKPTGAALSVIKTRGTDLVCTWTPDGSVTGKGVILTTSLGTLLSTDEYLVEIEGAPKGYHAATDSAKAMVTNAMPYCADGLIADYLGEAHEIIKPLLVEGYNAFSLAITLGSAADYVTILASNELTATTFYDITALALGVQRVTQSGAYQSADPLMFQWIKLHIDATSSNASVTMTRFRK